MSKTPRTDEQLKLEAFFDGIGIVETVEIEFAQQLETELAEARAEIERLSSRDGNASHELVYDDGDNPFAREKLEHVDFGVCDNQYVLESHLLNNALDALKEARAEIERLKNKENEADALLRKCLHLFKEQAERGE